jgi:hypothetical protein
MQAQQLRCPLATQLVGKDGFPSINVCESADVTTRLQGLQPSTSPGKASSPAQGIAQRAKLSLPRSHGPTTALASHGTSDLFRTLARSIRPNPKQGLDLLYQWALLAECQLVLKEPLLSTLSPGLLAALQGTANQVKPSSDADCGTCSRTHFTPPFLFGKSRRSHGSPVYQASAVQPYFSSRCSSSPGAPSGI